MDESFSLGAGSVLVGADGRVELLAAGRSGFAMPVGRGPVARTFSETIRGQTAIYDFRRTDEVATELLRSGDASLVDGILTVPYGSADGAYAGRLEIEEETGERTRFRFTVDAGAADSLAVPIRCDDGGSFHGFGVQYNGTDQRGEAFELVVGEQGLGREGGVRVLSGDEHTTYFPMPYYLDARGFGALFRTDYRVDVDLCAADADVAWIEVASGAPVEWVVLHGPTPLDVVRQLGDEVGRPAPLPDWAFGLWVASQGGRDEVMAEVDALEAADVPVAAFWVQDWTGVRMNFGGGFGVQYRWQDDAAHYPDLPGMVAELHGRGYRFLAYANPFVAMELPNHFPELDAMGLLVQSPEGGSYVFGAPNGMASHPDLTNADTRAYVVDALREMVSVYGFDGWMQDFGEWTPFDAVLSDGSDPLAYHNRFTVEWQQMAREALDAERPDGDYCFIGRSGWTGVQSVAQIHWIGDQEASFGAGDGISTVVPALLNMGLAGQFNATLDIGGFSGGPSTKELWQRWVELGAFTPIMRTHEGDDKEGNWSWEKDEETTTHFARFARVHEALFDTFRALADEAQASSAPMVRHMMLVFPDDPATWDLSDQFMLGGDLLVAPVTEQGATSRSVYLPAGTWFDVWTGAPHEGGRRVTVDAPIGSPPVFSRGADRADLRAVE